MRSPTLHVLADDLSGAAECAAAVARAARQPTALVLKGALPAHGSWSVDTDSRALPPDTAAIVATSALREAAAGDTAVLFKKIDSTLRGNVAPELRAVLAVRNLIDAAVVCPTLPSQGRTLLGGVLHIHGRPQVDRDFRSLDLLRLLHAAGAEPVRLRLAHGATAGELASELIGCVRWGARILVVDAAGDDDLRRLAQALLAARDGARLLSVGSAGLASALADELLVASETDTPALHVPREGSLVAVVGSFNPVTTMQLDELANEADVHHVRLDASCWLNRADAVASELTKAAEQADRGKSIVITATGAVSGKSTRELVQRIAVAAEPMIRRAGILVLTGGDTARTVLDRLGVERLQVLGELEPGICLSGGGVDSPAIVTKAGGFGDRHSLVRVLRHFRPTASTNTSPESKA